MNPTVLSVAVVALLSVAACQKGKSEEQQQKVTAPAPVDKPPRPTIPTEPLPPAIDPAAISWEPLKTGTGFSFDTIAGVDKQTGEMNGSMYTRQDKRPVAIALWSGEGRTLERWRKGLSAKAELGPETPIEVCGQKALRQEAKLSGSKVRVGGAAEAMAPEIIKDLTGGSGEAEPAQAPPAAPTGEVRFRLIPARTVIAIGLAHKGTPLIVSWTVETDQRDAFRSAEEHFLASLRCE